MTTLQATIDFTGTNGSAFPASLALGSDPSVGGGCTIQGNAGRMSTGTHGGYSGLDRISRKIAIAAVADVEFTGSWQVDATECYPNISVRSSSGAIDGGTDYTLSLGGAGSFSTQVVMSKNVAFVNTVLGTSLFTISSGVLYNFRFRAVGTTIQARVWAAASAEPNSWNITATDSSISAAGFVGMSAGGGSAASSSNVFWDDLTVTDGGAGGTAAAPVFVAKTDTVFAAAGSSFAFNTPAGAAAGNVLLAVFTYNPTSTTDVANTVPAGWTAIGTGAFDSGSSLGSAHIQAATKTAIGGAEAHTWTTASSVGDGIVTVLAYSGADTTTPMADFSYLDEASSVTAHVSGSTTPSVTNTVLIAAHAVRNNDDLGATTTSPTLAMTSRSANVSANGGASGTAGIHVQIADSGTSTVAASTAYTATSSSTISTSVSVKFLGALRPAAAGGGGGGTAAPLFTRFPAVDAYDTRKYQSLVLSVRVQETTQKPAPTSWGTVFVYHFDSNAVLIDEQVIRFQGDNHNPLGSGFICYPLIQVPCIGVSAVIYVIFDTVGLTGKLSLTGSYRQIPTPRVFNGGAYFGSSGNGAIGGGGVDGWTYFAATVPAGATWAERPYCWAGPGQLQVDIAGAITGAGADVYLADDVTGVLLAGQRGITCAAKTVLTFPVNVPAGPVKFVITNNTAGAIPQITTVLTTHLSQ